MSGTVYYSREQAEIVLSNRSQILERINKCIEDKYFVEAIIIIHSALENYTYLLLDRLHIPYKSTDRIFQCMEYLRWQIADAGDLMGHNTYSEKNRINIPETFRADLRKKLFDSGLIDRISEWKKKRNILVHDIAVNIWNSDILSDLAKDGLQLFLDYERSSENVIRMNIPAESDETIPEGSCGINRFFNS